MNPPRGTKLGGYKGVAIYVNSAGTCLSAPSMGLYGYAYESNLYRAISRKLAEKAKKKSGKAS